VNHNKLEWYTILASIVIMLSTGCGVSKVSPSNEVIVETSPPQTASVSVIATNVMTQRASFVSTAFTPTLLPPTSMSTPVRTSDWQILIQKVELFEEPNTYIYLWLIDQPGITERTSLAMLIHCLSELPLPAGELTCPLSDPEGKMKFMTVALGQDSAKEVGLNVLASLSLLTEETQSFKLENIKVSDPNGVEKGAFGIAGADGPSALVTTTLEVEKGEYNIRMLFIVPNKSEYILHFFDLPPIILPEPTD
jgi:hypothetical protein